MFERIKLLVLRLTKVPHEPEPPAGSQGSVRVFRASKRFFQLNLVRWGLAQVSTLIGIIVALTFLRTGAFGVEAVLNRIPYEDLTLMLITAAEFVGIGLFIIQLPFSFFLVVLDWEMRWYIVTDRSLRIREGIFRVKEMTMTFANVQEVSIQQGPLQRVLGISDLRVRTAGGGGGAGPPAKRREQEAHSLHIGYFHGVDNASEIRDLILERLKQLRDAGLGDPDQAGTDSGESAQETTAAGLLAAARGLLEESRALRQGVSQSRSI